MLSFFLGRTGDIPPFIAFILSSTLECFETGNQMVYGSIFISGEALARTKRNPERLTAYACENSRLNISCASGQYLDIIRANYGRFSITICNDHGNTEWKVDCQAGRTLRAMQARWALLLFHVKIRNSASKYWEFVAISLKKKWMTPLREKCNLWLFYAYFKMMLF